METQRLNAMIFSGSSGFNAQMKLIQKKNMSLRTNAEAANQIAKMRFNIGIEKARKSELERQIDENGRK